MEFPEINEKLKHYGQVHLLKFFEELGPSQKKKLLSQIESLDFDLIQNLFHSLNKEGPHPIDPEDLSPPICDSMTSLPENEKQTLTRQGMEALGEGKVAVFLVAGGQGSRLGHAGPKGTLEIGLSPGDSLFQLQADRLLERGREAGRSIPWYIMTSPENHEATVRYFEDKNYLGVSPSNLHFFSQGVLPAVDSNGKILMESRENITLSPNGNGGCFKALYDSGSLNAMRKKEIEWVFFYSVDNALVKIADPLFIGYTLRSGTPVGSKVVLKTDPAEKVGLLLRRKGRPAVIEYSDMPETLLNQRTSEGDLRYNCGNIAIHLFSLEFLLNNCRQDLPYHRAHKKIPTIDERGEPLRPQSPNGYKFEMFMFDLFPRAEGMAALSVAREEEFAPIKNREGPDSLASARELLLRSRNKPGESV